MFTLQKEQKLGILKAAIAQKKERRRSSAQPEIAAVAEIDSSFNNNVETKVAPNNDVGLRNRRNGEATTNGEATNTVTQSAVTDLERTTSLRGITVLRGQTQKDVSGHPSVLQRIPC